VERILGAALGRTGGRRFLLGRGLDAQRVTVVTEVVHLDGRRNGLSDAGLEIRSRFEGQTRASISSISMGFAVCDRTISAARGGVEAGAEPSAIIFRSVVAAVGAADVVGTINHRRPGPFLSNFSQEPDAHQERQTENKLPPRRPRYDGVCSTVITSLITPLSIANENSSTKCPVQGAFSRASLSPAAGSVYWNAHRRSYATPTLSVNSGRSRRVRTNR
jgi:hypothetical protein